MGLVDEWRMLRAGHAPWGMAGPGFHAQRIFELAVAMLEAHGLTLPQETEPLWGLDRNEKLSWRQRELAAIRRRFRLASRAWLDELNKSTPDPVIVLLRHNRDAIARYQARFAKPKPPRRRRPRSP